MIGIVTLLLPGLAQLERGDPRRAGTIFFSALVTALLTGGLGWFACGIWSFVDQQKHPVFKTSGSSSGTPAAKQPTSTSIGWVFKFSTLAICAAIVFQTIGAGNALQSLKFFGVEMQFSSALATRGDDQAEVESSVPADVAGNEVEVATAALRADARVPLPNAEPIVESGPAMPSEAVELGGTWTSEEGATYQIAQYGSAIQIQETSYIFYIPVQTMVCEGNASGADLVAHCTTYLGTTGEVSLSLSDGALLGTYEDFSTGGRVPVRFTRY